jgi:hypothetical protein
VADPIAAACRRRLADGPQRRWHWALGSGLLGTGILWLMAPGLAVLLWHARTRRTLTPAIYGLTLFGGLAFALATFDGLAVSPAVIAIGGLAVFAFGHRQGQDKAARNGRRWLDLDR